jgi:ribosomal protein S27AE
MDAVDVLLQSKEMQELMKKKNHICIKCGTTNQFSLHGKCLNCDNIQYPRKKVVEAK